MNAAWKTKRSRAAPGLSQARSSSPAIEKMDGPITVIARGGDELQVGFEKIGNQFRHVTLPVRLTSFSKARSKFESSVIPSEVEESLILKRNSERCLDFARHDN